MSKDAEEDIIASGEALATVASWLGVADPTEVMEKEGLNPEFEMGRTQGLGLGAKFLSHHKAVALVSGVEHRLSSKLKRSAERQHASSHAAAASHGRGALHHLGGTKHGHAAHAHSHPRQERGAQQVAGARAQQGGSRGGGEEEEEEEEESDEEDARGKAFGRGKQSAQRPATFSRSDLLKTSAAAQGKKRKRKSGGSGGGGGGGSSGTATGS